MESFSLLIVEDEGSELNRLERAFTRLEPLARIVRATDPVAACNQFRKHRPEVVILDLGLSGHGPEAGLEVVTKLSSIDPSARIVVLTGYTSEEIGVRAIKNGAASFLTKPANVTVLHALVRDFAQTSRFRRTRPEVDPFEPLPGFVGNGAAMQSVYRLVRQCALTESNVLIVGETGTGKELVAQAIHALGPRRNGPLSIYFGSSPEGLAEAELFGYAPGAFTGASRQGREGAVKRADGGTLFIDELCSLELSVQRKLLRVLGDKTFSPLGADREMRSDFRLVCAAQPRIYDFARSGRFREDLLSRVEVVTIHLPPLRERKDDIVALADSFEHQVKAELLQSGVHCAVSGLTREAQHAIRDYSWPRNVRELKHVIHNGIIQAQLRGGEKIDLADIQARLRDSTAAEIRGDEPVANGMPLAGGTLREAVERVERTIIAESLARNANVLSAVCQELGVGRTTLWRKLRQYDLQAQDY